MSFRCILYLITLKRLHPPFFPPTHLRLTPSGLLLRNLLLGCRDAGLQDVVRLLLAEGDDGGVVHIGKCLADTRERLVFALVVQVGAEVGVDAGFVGLGCC